MQKAQANVYETVACRVADKRRIQKLKQLEGRTITELMRRIIDEACIARGLNPHTLEHLDGRTRRNGRRST